MDWSGDLEWIRVPIDPETGEDDYLGSESPLVAFVGWKLDMDPVSAVPEATVLRRLDGRVTAGDQRLAQWSKVIAASRDLLEASTLMHSLADPEVRAAARAAGEALREKARTGERATTGWSDAHLEQVARIYNDAVDRGRSPTAEILRVFRAEYPTLKDTTVKGWIRSARRRPGIHMKRARQPRRTDPKGGGKDE